MNEKDRSASKKENEIVVTPAMIEAGMSVYLRYDSRFDEDELVVKEIYRAMQVVHQGRQKKG